MDLKKKKKELRALFKSYRDNLPVDFRLQASEKIKERLFEQPEFQNSSCPMFFVSFRSEVNTHEMIKKALDMGKNVVIPVSDPRKKELKLSLLRDFDRDLQPGEYGILEPVSQAFRPVEKELVDLVLVPGLVFDKYGYRIGYGGGYYDRFLEQLSGEIPLIGLCFDGQLVDEIPHGIYDFPVHMVITEEQVIEINRS